ncbi:MAG: sigma-54-dependent transcriptional regulator [Deferrisomatales bacterium]
MVERAKILVVDDEAPLRELLRMELGRAGHQVVTAGRGEEGLARYREEIFNVVLLDIRMPGIDGVETLRRMRGESTIPEVIMLTGHGTIESAVECIKEGAYDYLTKPVKLDELDLVIRKAHEKNRLRIENISLKLEVGKYAPHRMVGKSRPIQNVLALVARLGPTDEHVLIEGESGTGKELVARAVHEASPRAELPFVAVNCGRFSAHTAESELFGHMQGSFTGANKGRAGLFELAHTGTLFLDEISEMPLDVQVRLLRVLETGSFRRLGGNRDIQVDVRCVFASNKDLPGCVSRGEFRADLYHRINLLPIRLPPLRERVEDIPLLVRHFLATSPVRTHESWEIDGAALHAMAAHPWPGNVRELKNAIRRACILAEGPRITADLLPFAPPREAWPRPRPGTAPLPALWEIEREHIRDVLAATEGNKSRAAEILQIDRKTLYAKIERYELQGVTDEAARAAG